MKTILSFGAFLICSMAVAQPASLPEPFAGFFKSKGLEATYSLSPTLKPTWLTADLNGDGVRDVAVFVVEKRSGKKGVLVMHGKTGKYFVFGAGTPVAKMDDLSWADRWSIYTKKTAYETLFDQRSGDIKGSRKTVLAHPGMLIEHLEDGAMTAGGILYYTGKGYRWIHQGD
jgi:hypothetical protein